MWCPCGTMGTPPAKSEILPPPASSMASYPSFPPKGEKLGHCASPPSPTEPNSAAVSSFAALRMRHTPCGYRTGWASAGTPMGEAKGAPFIFPNFVAFCWKLWYCGNGAASNGRRLAPPLRGAASDPRLHGRGVIQWLHIRTYFSS